MSRVRQFLVRAMNLLLRRRQDERFRSEMEEHIRLQTEENLRAGMPVNEALREARLKLGPVESIKEAYRDQESIPLLETVFADLKYGIRVLRKSPGFTTAAIATLALGIGANTAIFSVVYGVVFRPLPYPDSEQIVELVSKSPRGVEEQDVADDELQFLQENGTSFASVAGYTTVGFNLGIGSSSQRSKCNPVSADYFRVLGTKPFLGRDFLPEEDTGNGARVAILSYATWKQRAGADPDMVGKTVTLDGEPYTVIGVLPPGVEPTFDPVLRGETDVWIPLAVVGGTVGRGENIEVLARLRPGTPLPQASLQLSVLTPQFRKNFPHELGPDTVLGVESYRAMLARDVRPILLVLFGAVGFVLLIACANVANLLLGRATARKRELAVRAALGASRRRLIRQLLTESTLLSMAGALAALLVGWIGMELMFAFTPAGLPRVGDIHLDGWTFGFTVALGVLTGLIFGLVPALRATSGDVNEKLGEASFRVSDGHSSGRARGALAVLELGLCLVLLTGAALMVETFWRVLNNDPGIKADHLLSVEVWLAGPHYQSTAAIYRYYNDVLARVKGLPGVRQASVIAAGLPLERGLNIGVAVDGNAVRRSTGARAVMPGYFETMGIPIVRGRAFSESENGKSPAVVVISEAAARLLSPERDPIGARIDIFGSDREIVGLVGDVRSYLDEPPEPLVYAPFQQVPYPILDLASNYFPTSIVVRSSQEPLALSPLIAEQCRAVDPSVPTGRVRTMDQMRSEAVAMRRFNMVLLSVFAGVALLLAAIGVYGVIAYGVTQRSHEFGVRLALGAKPGEIIKLVFVEGMSLILLGIVAGVAGTLMVTRLLTGYLYGVRSSDPLILATTTLFLVFVATIALIVPARQAAMVDPMVALRCE